MSVLNTVHKNQLTCRPLVICPATQYPRRGIPWEIKTLFFWTKILQYCMRICALPFICKTLNLGHSKQILWRQILLWLAYPLILGNGIKKEPNIFVGFLHWLYYRHLRLVLLLLNFSCNSKLAFRQSSSKKEISIQPFSVHLTASAYHLLPLGLATPIMTFNSIHQFRSNLEKVNVSDMLHPRKFLLHPLKKTTLWKYSV